MADLTKKQLDILTYKIIGCAIEVQKTLGRGLLESVYQSCLEEEFRYNKIKFRRELKTPVYYREKLLEINFRCDFFIEECIVLEIKSVKQFTIAFEAQLLTYMRLLKAPKGILINFNSSGIINAGQKTYVNEYFRDLEPG